MMTAPPTAPTGALASPGEPVIRIRGLSFAYPGKQGHTVFENLCLDVGHGEFVAVLGASGCGKSTLLRVISGLLKPSFGQVAAEPAGSSQARPLALVFQDPRLLPWRSVVGNVELGLEGLAVNRHQRRERAMAALASVGLDSHAGRWPHQLSGGQRQRVGLARALAVRPNLLLMDEPFAALDPANRRSMQDLVLDLWRSSGTSVVFVTHDVEEAVLLADRVVVLGSTPSRVLHQTRVEVGRPNRRGSAGAAALVKTLNDWIGPAVGPCDPLLPGEETWQREPS